jgi:hypothetical protein
MGEERRMTRNTPSKRRQNLSPAMQVTVIVALIGCIGTILAAIVSGAFMYWTTRAQIDRPIAFTQTAAFLPTPQVQVFEWQNVLSVDPASLCPSVYTPDHLFGGLDKFSWVRDRHDEFIGLYHNDKLMYAPQFMSDNPNELEASFTITNSPDNQAWIRLSKDVKVSIRFVDNPPPTSEIMQFSGCGGGGAYRYFSPVSLNRDYPEYNVSSSSSDADFYTLQPGEFEIFILRFQCNAPGLYAVSLNIPIQFQGREETVTYVDFPGVNCPGQLNYNSFDLEIYSVEQYDWAGTAYERTGP